MSGPVWLSKEVVLATQDELLERFGGLAGIRDEGLLDSALGRPQNLHAHGRPELAAAYAFGIVKSHPFLDGNKRIGFMAAYIFLGANGMVFSASEEEVVERTLALAAGVIGEEEYAAWLARSCAPE
jgi:death on curing protein